MKPAPKLLVLCKAADVAALIAKISDAACAGWRNYVDVKVIGDRMDAQNRFKGVNYQENTNEVVEGWQERRYYKIIADDKLALDLKLLKEERVHVIFRKTHTSMFEEIRTELKNKKIHWLEHSSHEWSQSSIPKLNPDKWCQQFEQLGIGWIGKALLKQLKVITDAELSYAFKVSKSQVIGEDVAHAYVADSEPGASSIKIKSALEHIYLKEEILELDLENFHTTLPKNLNVLYIYEDGLWSGVELVKRLEKICLHPAFKDINARIVFRFAATSDAGVLAGRLFNKLNKFLNVQVDSAHDKFHYVFLKVDAEKALKGISEVSHLRKAIDAEIVPMAFQPSEIWNGREAEALDICTELGKQLAEPFLQRREFEELQKKGAAPKDAATISIPDEKLKRWALGAMQFGSTVVFSSSVPKPVIPLMWLQGAVKLNGKPTNWQPLFGDSRRINAIQYREEDLH